MNPKFFLANLLGFSLLTATVNAISPRATTVPVQPPNVGLFSLPSSQAPGTFFSFGQNIIDKHQLQITLDPSYIKGDDQSFLLLTPSVLYGLSDSASLYFTVPYALDYRSGNQHAAGIADSNVQFEYAFYQASDAVKTETATVVTGITLPTGSFTKSPATGFGSPTYFLGGTYNRTYVDWLWFVSPGILMLSPHSNIHYGSQYLYQFGTGHTILLIKDKYTFFGLLELDGLYSEKNKVLGQFDPDSGGNLLLLTPSVSLATEKFIVQLGLSLPVSQHLYGNQPSNKYFLAATLAWTVNS